MIRGDRIDVRNDPLIQKKLEELRKKAKPVTDTQRVLTDVVVVIGETLYSLTPDDVLVDAYGNEGTGFSGVMRVVAYIPVDQGGNPMGTGDVWWKEKVTTERGQVPSVSASPSNPNSAGVWIDMQQAEADTAPTQLKQTVSVIQGVPKAGAFDQTGRRYDFQLTIAKTKDTITVDLVSTKITEVQKK